MAIKRIDLKIFMDLGYLQEVNRQFFHPLGLALEVVIDDESGEISLGGIWDYRDDPEGMLFADGQLDQEKARRVQEAWSEKERYSLRQFGYMIQPVD